MFKSVRFDVSDDVITAVANAQKLREIRILVKGTAQRQSPRRVEWQYVAEGPLAPRGAHLDEGGSGVRQGQPQDVRRYQYVLMRPSGYARHPVEIYVVGSSESLIAKERKPVIRCVVQLAIAWTEHRMHHKFHRLAEPDHRAACIL